MSIKIDLILKNKRDIERLPDMIKPAMRDALRDIEKKIQTSVEEAYDKSGLAIRSGTLKRGIDTFSSEEGDKYEAGATDDVRYAGVHELGATITAVNEEYMTFQWGAGAWAKKRVVRIPARPFIGPGVEDAADDDIEDIVQDKIEDALEGRGRRY